MVTLPAMHCSCYELEISREKIFVAMLRPVKSTKIFNLENFRLYGICEQGLSGVPQVWDN